MELETSLDQLEEVSNRCDEALDLVAKGEAWLREHPLTHPLYSKAQKHLAKRKRELAQIEQEFEQALARFHTAMAEFQGDRECQAGGNFVYDVLEGHEPSTNCLHCGNPVTGAPSPHPGYHVHIDCFEEWQAEASKKGKIANPVS